VTARVTAEEVKQVVRTDIIDDTVLTNMIDTANLLVDEELVGEADHSDARLKKIELYLSAHYVALTEEGGGVTRSKLGDADESYANVYDAGLQSTRFGQNAASLDTSGILAALTPKLKAAFRVV
jgi:hypothetical protein